jgi:hypothetical protein
MLAIWRFAVSAAAALACGAALAQSDLEAFDRGVLVPSIRLGVDISPRGERPAAPHSGHGIELGFSGSSGEDTQTVGAGVAPVVFGGRTFFGPTELRHEFDFRFAEVAYRYRHFFGGGTFGIEALGGLGWAELDLTTSSPLATANDKLSNAGIVGAFGIIWKFLPDTSLQSRITLFGSGESEGVTGAGRLDVHIAHALTRNIGLRGGLVAWGFGSIRADDDDTSSFNSRIRAGFSGLSLGLDIAF